MQFDLNKPVLAIETATPVCSVSMRLPDGNVFEERTEGKGVHSDWTFVFIQSLLDRGKLRAGDLGGVLISSGPGSFTGLRVASSAVKGLLFDLDIPLFACNTLAGIAAGVWCRHFSDDGDFRQTDPLTVHTVIDARRNHLYHQSWKVSSDGITPENTAEARSLDELLPVCIENPNFFGTGLDRMEQLIDSQQGKGKLLPYLNDLEVISARNYFYFMDSPQFRDFALKEHAGASVFESLVKMVDPASFEPHYYS
ncbi:tRNA (adenosine(37)-N6)-threonylcarbamoyltransferase complex dimerization subunit type 1 TsaB [Natronogracilivirga saccharolytica]|uniref:tRNA (Adenosine(37)-N6)-threonylcarbamoyltransferase complex dimerization subunit type 1 TsaB n=1 Tax=Natronogracilivirga saccharolytica TaxID=2812953 RepID=A0A8J7RNW4_9BACT|nr:tRNA (adenosine(37)-N6)-threonylcarbamoyltransferase complex dimerization subunit type 1 TsaB [Natronogracilivirga saccharolytica]MBP3191129.1 tRNA (adenosine(37)-N6)-threonylcarbamoyltransferase complex dimerization subunit type 1 TsaB [Natronogracilivirga saccharolytica]